ncbi:MAG TPA: hypothetical protein VMU83_01385 [Hanamia sp.]|nr:hypothetical protein [Hanamia sp.]
MKNGVTKVLCTSKGVLSDLENKIIKPGDKGFGKVDCQKSKDFQDHFLKRMNANLELITNPVARVFVFGNRTIQAIAIPSPGSPQRKIDKFGCSGDNLKLYAENYFSEAFKWLLE